ncbi:MAG: 6,7-dimethyl-8-ribityllumazine synthase [Candidatus Levyibacteriota bacterium]
MLKTQTKATFDKTFTKDLKVAIIRTNYHVELTENLEMYAKQTLLDAGLQEKNVQTFIAPGSWEVPLLVQAVAKKKTFDAIIAFGVIVKGETLSLRNACQRSRSGLNATFT